MQLNGQFALCLAAKECPAQPAAEPQAPPHLCQQITHPAPSCRFVSHHEQGGLTCTLSKNSNQRCVDSYRFSSELCLPPPL